MVSGTGFGQQPKPVAETKETAAAVEMNVAEKQF